MKELSFLDKMFLLSENREHPMHVGGVNLYTLPKGADAVTFTQEITRLMATADEFMTPFGDRVKSGPLGLIGQTYWEPDPDMDVDYHVRRSALPGPGSYRELFSLVSRLHSTLRDRKRPLWEVHRIEGLQNRQFAVYTNTHHVAVDGARSVHLGRSRLSTSPRARMTEAPLSDASWNRYRASLPRREKPELTDRQLLNVAELLKERYDSSANLFGALKSFTSAWMGNDDALSLPFLRVPTSAINTHVDGAPRFVAQSWPFQRIY